MADDAYTAVTSHRTGRVTAGLIVSRVPERHTRKPASLTLYAQRPLVGDHPDPSS